MAGLLDLYNRQLHPDETAKLEALKKGKTREEQQRLTDASCALTHCSAGVPDSDPNKANLIASEQRGQQYTAEQSALRSDGLFGYTGLDQFHDAMDRYQVSDRAVGAVQGVTAAAAAAGALSGGCATLVGCGLGAMVAGTSLDYSKAGFEQLVNGDLAATYGEQVLRSLGMSDEAAALAYGALSLGGAAGISALENQAGKQAAAFNEAAKLSYTPIEKFGAKGVQITPEVMKTPQAQALVDVYMASGLPLEDAAKFTAGLVKTGASLPTALVVKADTELIKVVPKGDGINKNSPYFMTRTEYDALSKLSADQVAAKLGLPVEQGIRGAQFGFEVYSMKPLPGTNAQAFTSQVAPVQQGAYSASGGAQQVLVPNRNQWTDPHANKIGELKGLR